MIGILQSCSKIYDSACFWLARGGVDKEDVHSWGVLALLQCLLLRDIGTGAKGVVGVSEDHQHCIGEVGHIIAYDQFRDVRVIISVHRLLHSSQRIGASRCCSTLHDAMLALQSMHRLWHAGTPINEAAFWTRLPLLLRICV